MKQIPIFLSAVLLATTTQAADWTGEGDLGYNSVSGNSNSESLALALAGGYETGKWLHAAGITAYNASTDDETSAESYELKFQTDYEISQSSYAFGNLRYLDDRFSGYDSQTSVTAGLGKTFIDDGISLFSGQLGAGYRSSEFQDGSDTESEAIVSGQVTYNRALTATTNFESSWSAESGSENTYLEGGVALIVSMTEQLGLKVSYTAKHNTEVPDGSKNTDRFTTVSLNYKFK